MVCPNCNNTVPDDSLFCQHCGVNIQEFTEEKRKAEEAEAARIAEEKRMAEEEESARVTEEKQMAGEDAIYKICPKCRRQLTVDSAFCQYCGNDLSVVKQHLPANELNLSNDELATNSTELSKVASMVDDKLYSTNNNSNEIVTTSRESINTPDTNPKTVGSKARLIVVILLIATLAGLNLFQYYLYSQSQTRIATLESQVSTKDLELIKTRTKAENYDFILNTALSGKLGFAAYNFYASEDVIVVSKNQTDRKFTLTANWTNGGTVSINYSPSDVNPAAWLSFDKNNWSTSVSITIEPIHVGITRATFSNNVDNKTFDVLIIVTD